MSAVGPIEYKKDILGERFYASRNYNDFSHTYKEPGTNGTSRAQIDWNLTLRQQRKNFGKSAKDSGSRSAPNLVTSEISKRESRDASHPDGPYHSTTATVGKYQNFASSVHMLHSLHRVSSGMAHTVDWQLNLRDGYHQKPDDKWRRHHTRPQQSFDMMAENCVASNQEYQNSHITPQDRRPDRRMGAISIETIRDDPISFRRNPGCEGTQVGQWEHLIQHRRYGHKARRQLGHETTLRQYKDDPNGAQIDDTRSNGCIVEMLGKKKWTGHLSHDELSRHPQDGGDVKLHHWSKLRIMPEEDNDNREQRKKKQPRTDTNISTAHPGKIKKKNKDSDDEK
jgi:hypothetical protein